MPETLKALRRRVRSIASTKQITRAMEMVSAAKLRRAQAVLMAGRPYARKLQELLAYLAESEATAGHPLFAERDPRRSLMVVFTADRGLCGAFNANLIRLVEQELSRPGETTWELYCVGRKGADYFRRRRWPIARVWQGLSGRPDVAVADAIMGDLVERFLTGQADAIWLYYQTFVTMAVFRPRMEKFLNLEAAALRGAAQPGASQERAAREYLLEPSASAVFDALLPRYLSSKIYITMAEVFTSEHSARMIAMNNATKNCEELVDTLTLRLNKARQAQITRELIDIVGGAEAV